MKVVEMEARFDVGLSATASSDCLSAVCLHTFRGRSRECEGGVQSVATLE